MQMIGHYYITNNSVVFNYRLQAKKNTTSNKTNSIEFGIETQSQYLPSIFYYLSSFASFF